MDFEIAVLALITGILVWVVGAGVIVLVATTGWTGVAILGGFAVTVSVIYKLMPRR